MFPAESVLTALHCPWLAALRRPAKARDCAPVVVWAWAVGCRVVLRSKNAIFAGSLVIMGLGAALKLGVQPVLKYPWWCPGYGETLAKIVNKGN